MPDMKHHFLQGKMNKDLDERLVPNGQYRHAMNIEVSSAEDAGVGVVKNILGNVKLCENSIYTTSSDTTVGSVVDEKSDAIYWMVAGKEWIPPFHTNGAANFPAPFGRDAIFKHTEDLGCETVITDVHSIFTELPFGLNTLSSNELHLIDASMVTTDMVVTGWDASAGGVHNLFTSQVIGLGSPLIEDIQYAPDVITTTVLPPPQTYPVEWKISWAFGSPVPTNVIRVATVHLTNNGIAIGDTITNGALPLNTTVTNITQSGSYVVVTLSAGATAVPQMGPGSPVWVAGGGVTVQGLPLNSSNLNVPTDIIYLNQPSTSLGVIAGMGASGINILPGTTVISVSGNQITLSTTLTSVGSPGPSGTNLVTFSSQSSSPLFVILKDEVIWTGVTHVTLNKPKVLGFKADTLITGINILEEFLMWTDNLTEPKKINTQRCIDGTTQGLAIEPTRFVEGGVDYGVLKEENITVIKKAPTKSLDLKLGGVDLNYRNRCYQSFRDANGDLPLQGDSITVTISNMTASSQMGYKQGDYIVMKQASSIGFVAAPYPITEPDLTFRVEETISDPFSTGAGALNGVIKVTLMSNIVSVELNGASGDYYVDVQGTPSRFSDSLPRFAYRYKYIDGEYSTISPFSNVGFLPSAFNYDSDDGYNIGMENYVQAIRLRNFLPPNIPVDVVEIDLLYKEDDAPEIYILDSIKKSTVGTQTNPAPWWVGGDGAFRGDYEITSLSTKGILPSPQLIRPWDAVPQKALAQEVVGNRIVYGNYVDGFDMVDDNGNPVTPIINATVIDRDYADGDISEFGSIKSLREYQLGITYFDEHGRETPVYTHANNIINLDSQYASSRNQLKLSVHGKWPSFAKGYRFYIKETGGEYYNIAIADAYAAEDGNVWISIYSSERNKITEDDYLYIKMSSAADYEFAGEKLRVLDIKSEAPKEVTHNYNIVGELIHIADPTLPALITFGPVEGKSKLSLDLANWLTTDVGDLTDVANVNTTEKWAVQFYMVGAVSDVYDVSYVTVDSLTDPTAWDHDALATGNIVDLKMTKSFKADVGFCGDGNTVPEKLGVRFFKITEKDEVETSGRFFVKTPNSVGLVSEEVPNSITPAEYKVVEDLSISKIGVNDGFNPANKGNWIDWQSDAEDGINSFYFIDEMDYVGEVDGPYTKKGGLWKTTDTVKPGGVSGGFDGTSLSICTGYGATNWNWGEGKKAKEDRGVGEEVDWKNVFTVGKYLRFKGDDDPQNTYKIVKAKKRYLINEFTSRAHAFEVIGGANVYAYAATIAGIVAIIPVIGWIIAAAIMLAATIGVEITVSTIWNRNVYNFRETWDITLNREYVDGGGFIPDGTGNATFTTSTKIEFVSLLRPGQAIPGQTLEVSAILETAPKEKIDINLFYGISQIYPVNIDHHTGEFVLPVGSIVTTRGSGLDVEIGKNAYLTINEGNRLTLSNVNATGGLNLVDGTVLRISFGGGYYSIAVEGDHLNTSVINIDSNLYHGHRTLDWYNCYSFGNGVESNRIRDDFNKPFLKNGVGVSTTLDEGGAHTRNSSGLIYSGIYNSRSKTNNLNQFIIGEKITKDLNPTFGSIQKLYTREKSDLVVLCEDKVIKVLANKDALYNADGNPQLISTNRVLGQAIPFVGNHGISQNPESFAADSFRSYFTDKQRGSVIRLSMNGLGTIDTMGMNDWFFDNLEPATLLMGSIDRRKGNYDLTLKGGEIDYTVSFNEETKGWVSFKSYIPEEGGSVGGKYYTFKEGHIWKHHQDSVEVNTFYNEFTNSTVEVVLNEVPSTVKSFSTISYEGSQSKVKEFIQVNSYTDAAGNQLTNIGDGNYHNLVDQKGWFVSSMHSDLSKGSVNEFINKEGKWFNHIKGFTNTVLDLDPSDFHFQGIGISGEATSQNLGGCTDPTMFNFNSWATFNNGSCVPIIEGCMDANSMLFNPLANTVDPNACAILGCINPAAFNYNPLATADNGSCIPVVLGCTDPLAANYNPLANTDDGTCAPATYGCTDPGSSNYNGYANVDDGSCIQCIYGCMDAAFIEFSALATCDDGSCTSPVVLGCTDPAALDYNSNATPGNADANNCLYPVTLMGCTDPTATNYYAGNTVDDGSCFWEGCTDVTATNYDAAATIDDGTCTYTGCTDPGAYNYDSNADFDDGSCLYCSQTVINIQTVVGASDNLYPNTNISYTNGAIALAVTSANTPYTFVWTNPAGSFSATTASIAGLSPGQYSVVVTDVNGCQDAFTFQVPSMTYGCMDATASNYDSTATQAHSSIPCIFPGCTDSLASNYDAAATVDDGSCVYPAVPIYGCTDSTATNYDATATVDDGSCTYPPIPVSGCTNAAATNFNALATVDDGSCVFPCNGAFNIATTTPSCEGVMDGMVQTSNVVGFFPGPLSTSWTGPNGFSTTTNGSFASIDTSGTYTCTVTDSLGCSVTNTVTIIGNNCGCTDPTATNHDAAATVDDGSCEYDGCMDSTAINYNPLATNNIAGSCLYCGISIPISSTNATNGAANGSISFGNIATTNTSTSYAWSIQGQNTGFNNTSSSSSISGLFFLSLLPDTYDILIIETDTMCEYSTSVTVGEDIDGCTDPLAYNFDPSATIDDSSCLYCDLSINNVIVTAPTTTMIGGISAVVSNTNWPGSEHFTWTLSIGGAAIDTANIVNGGSYTHSSLGVGTYSLSISSTETGCVASTIFNIVSPCPGALLSLTSNTTDAGGAAFGAIDTTVAGGIQPYAYNWVIAANTSNGAVIPAGMEHDADLTGLTAGGYIITVEDACGNTLTRQYDVSQ